MAKKKTPIDSDDSPEDFTFEEYDKIKEDLSKDLKKLKPRKPNLPSEKRLKSMAQKKTEGVLDEAKQMYKDQIELKLLQKQDRELNEAIKAQQPPPQQAPIQQSPPQQAPIQQSPPPQAPHATEDEAFKNLKPKDLQGIDDDILEKYIRIKLLDKQPQMSQLLSGNNKNTSLKEIVEIVSLIVDAKGGGGQKQSDSEMVKLMMDQQKQQADFQLKVLEKVYDDKEQKYLDKIAELEERANINPFAWLKHKKGEMEELKDLFGKAQAVDPKTRIELEQVKADNKLKTLEYRERMQEKALSKSNASEFTSLIRDGMKEFSDSISKAVGAAIGEMGKQQLENINIPPFIPIDQIDNQPQIPIVNPLLKDFSLPQNQQPIMTNINPPQPSNVKKQYGSGFKVHESK
jgi:hypothetical protein